VKPSEHDPNTFERFQSFLTKLVRVPKLEIDEQEAKYRQERQQRRALNSRTTKRPASKRAVKKR
jgi:hypothetical protein